MKYTIIFTWIIFFALNICFAQENNYTENIEILKAKLSIIIELYNNDKPSINSQEFEGILIFLHGIFDEENNFKFDIKDDFKTLRIFDKTNLIAELFLYFDFILNNFNVKEYTYIKGNLFIDGNIHTIQIMDDPNNIENHSLVFSFTSADLTNKLYYLNTYYTNGYEMFVTFTFDMIDAPSYPLLRKSIIYRN
jgi:hypothetical protein